jgi:hypothetical protein
LPAKTTAPGGLPLCDQPLPIDLLASGDAREQIGIGRACFGDECDGQSSDPAAAEVTALSGAMAMKPTTLT